MRRGSLDEAIQLVDRKDTELVALVREMLSIDTTNPPGREYERMVDYLASHLRPLGFRNQRILVPEAQWGSLPLPLAGPRVNLVSRRRYGGGREDITITAHLDTVPAGGDWTYKPFRGTIELGRIYGRGVADVKGAIASLLVAFEVLGQLRLPARYNVTLCLTTDEEVGGFPGSRELARRGFFKGHVLCLEGPQDPVEYVAAAGMVDVHVTTKGMACHTGVNHLGLNAVEEMLPILNELIAVKRDVEARPVPADVGVGAGPDAVRPTFTISVIRGGEKSNVVPDRCTVIVNRRYAPDETQDAVVGEIAAAVQRGGARSRAEVTTEVLPGFPALTIDLANPHAAKLRQARKLVCGYTDADFRRRAATHSYSLGFVQAITGRRDFYFLGLGRPESHEHGLDECCRLVDLKNLTKQLIYYLAA